MSVIQEFSPIAWVILGLLGLMSVFAASVVLVKLGQFARAGVGSRTVGRAVAERLGQAQAGGADPAQGLEGATALRLQVLAVALQDPTQAMARAREGLDALSQHMRGLDAVVQAAPMLGLLGTVVGMIEAFGRLAATSGAADPALLAGGIWTALVTTAMGLSIAILFYLLALWLEGRIAGEAQALERLIAAAGAANQSAPQPTPTRATTLPPEPAPAPRTQVQPLPGGASSIQRTNPGAPPPQREEAPPPEGFPRRQ